ncbi:MAG: hypothetical protein ACQER6_07040 [Pseudomonadota bacterium]
MSMRETTITTRSLAGVVLALAISQAAPAAELTARTAVFGTLAHPGNDDVAAARDWPSADQQSLRLMLDDITDHGDWSLHVKTRRLHLDGLPGGGFASAGNFRYQPLAQDWIDRGRAADTTRVGYELDRAVYRWRQRNLELAIGRQPIDWGAGRFWQPLNVFGAFAPTDLDTDFKPGIDAVVLDWYPDPLSSLTVAGVLSPRDGSSEDSLAIHYRRQLGMRSALALLAGRVRGDNVLGASLEGEVKGVGWRVEAARHGLAESRDGDLFWIAGLDYQLGDGTRLVAEWYDHGAGAGSADSLPAVAHSERFASGLMPQLGRQTLGLGAERDLTPLLRGSYTLLASPLAEGDGGRRPSLLHQVNLDYSLGDESDLLVSLLVGSGDGLGPDGQPRTEFGHLPASLSIRWRHYF